MEPTQKRLEKAVGVVAIALLFIFLVLGFIFLLQKPSKFSSMFSRLAQEVKITPTPAPRPIPHGMKGFTVGQGNRKVPQFGRGSIDPYDPKKGESQTITIAVKHSMPVSKVTATVTTDNESSQPIIFTLLSGTETDGVWQGSWKMKDSYLYSYVLTLEAISADGVAKVPIVLR